MSSPTKPAMPKDTQQTTKQKTKQTTKQMNKLEVVNLGVQEYESCFDAMQKVINERIDKKRNHNIITTNQLWLVEHPNVFTLGQAGKREHIIQQTTTPIVTTDRGGQVTWHGYGQLVGYFLFDIESLGWHVRQLVNTAEVITIELLEHYLDKKYYVKARKDAPGVYIYCKQTDMELGKVASLGFKIKRGFSYHGIAINICADMADFACINPCGYAGMSMLNLLDYADHSTLPNDASEVSAFEVIQSHLADIITRYHNKDL